MLIFFFLILLHTRCFFFFFFNDTATTEIYTLSLHDALPISTTTSVHAGTTSTRSSTTSFGTSSCDSCKRWLRRATDRKSTRLNSSHDQISYAVFCLKKKKQKT